MNLTLNQEGLSFTLYKHFSQNLVSENLCNIFTSSSYTEVQEFSTLLTQFSEPELAIHDARYPENTNASSHIMCNSLSEPNEQIKNLNSSTKMY